MAPAPAALAGGTSLPAGSGQEIVCIDDDSLVLEISTSLVKRLGYRVRAFGQPAAAEAFLMAPDSANAVAVICDFAMPEVDGITLAQRWPGSAATCRGSCSRAYLSEETLQRARAAGLEYFIDKPPAIEQIARTLRRILAASAGEVTSNSPFGLQ